VLPELRSTPQTDSIIAKRLFGGGRVSKSSAKAGWEWIPEY
jgi:hypothetical protein